MKVGGFFILFLICVLSGFSATDNVTQGVLDIRGWDYNENHSISLDGEWLFYWGQHIKPEELLGRKKPDGYKTITVPMAWNSPSQENRCPAIGYGTYYLKIIADKKWDTYALQIKPVGSSMHIYVNGNLHARQGVAGVDAENTVPSFEKQIAFVSDPIEFDNYNVYHVVVHVSNFSHAYGGIRDRVSFGKARYIVRSFYRKMFWGILVSGLLFMIFLFHLILFFLSKERINFAFSILVFLVFLLSVTNEGRWIYYAFPRLDFEVFIKLAYLSAYVMPGVIVWYLSLFYPKENTKLALTFQYTLYALIALCIIVFPARISSGLQFVFALVIFISLIYVIFHVMGFALMRKRNSAVWNMLAVLIILVSGVNDLLFTMDFIHTEYVAHFGIFVFVMMQEYYLISISAQEKIKIKKLSEELLDLNQDLENQVETRIKQLAEQNESLLEKSVKLNSANEMLKELQAYQNKLTYMLVHDLKAPVGTILQLTDVVKEPDANFVQIIRDSSLKMQRLVLNILDIQQLERAELQLNMAHYSISQIVKTSIKHFEYQAELKQIFIEYDVPENEYVFVDKYMLERVLDNIIDNAVKHIRRGDRVFITCERIILKSAPAIQIVISDNGPGIPLDKQYMIFSGKHAKTTTDSYFSSHGLGLTFCKMAVSAMDGEIDFSSDSESGTKFFIRLPRIKLS